MVARKRLCMTPTMLSELPLIGHNHILRAGDFGLQAHRHDVWEICWIAAGNLEWWSADSIHEIGPGDCYLTPPGQSHGAVTGLLESCDLWWCHLDLGRIGGLNPVEIKQLQQTLQRLPQIFPLGDIGFLWSDLLCAIQSKGAWSQMMARGALYRLLGTILGGERRQAPSTEIARAIASVQTERGTVQSMARAAKLSRAEFQKRFHAEMGDSPAQWLRRQRIRQAKRLLVQTHKTMTCIAHDLDFSSSQHFATVFQQQVGCTPSAYRRRLQKDGFGNES